MPGTSTLYHTCPSHVPVLGKFLAHLKARLASTKLPRKVAADGSKLPAEGHSPGCMEPPSHTNQRQWGNQGIRGEELPPSLKQHGTANSKHVLPLLTTAVKARAPGRPAGLAQGQRWQRGTRQTSPCGEGVLERHSWELGCSSIQQIIPISAYRFVLSPCSSFPSFAASFPLSLALLSILKQRPSPGLFSHSSPLLLFPPATSSMPSQRQDCSSSKVTELSVQPAAPRCPIQGSLAVPSLCREPPLTPTRSLVLVTSVE